MFKIGEKVICVNSGNVALAPRWNIKKGNIYTVESYFDDNEATFVRIKGEISEEDFFAWRFRSVKEQRKLKLKKLYEST